MKQRLAAFTVVLMTLITACNGGSSGGNNTSSGDPAADAVLRYLQAKVASNRDDVRDLLCSSMEGDLEREALSFSGVNAQLENVSCASDAGGTTVTCTGNITAVYGTENRSFPLSRYNVVQEDGQWRWCGEAP